MPTDDDERYTLTRQGWCEVLGLSSEAAEALDR